MRQGTGEREKERERVSQDGCCTLCISLTVNSRSNIARGSLKSTLTHFMACLACLGWPFWASLVSSGWRQLEEEEEKEKKKGVEKKEKEEEMEILRGRREDSPGHSLMLLHDDGSCVLDDVETILNWSPTSNNNHMIVT